MNESLRTVWSRSVAALAVILAAAFAALLWHPWTPEEVVPDHGVHYHAGFQIYVDGALQDYAGERYMHVKPCTDVHGVAVVEEQKTHLHDGVGDVAHVHAAGIPWRRFLEENAISAPLEASLMNIYVDGVKVEDAGAFLDREIVAYESVVFVIGDEPEGLASRLEERVKKDHILYWEGQSENCGG